MRAGRRSKMVAFVAILALTTFGALATASAQPADIKAIDKAFQDHYARGNYPAAQIDAQELERLVKARFGADHAYYAVALRKLGIVFQAQGKLGEAEELLKRALAISEQALGNSHPDVAQALHNLALVSWNQGKYSEAEGLYKRALAIRETALGANHRDVAQTLNNLALVYRDQGKYVEAEAFFERALAIRENALGASHPDVGTTLNNLANVYRDQGKYGEAEELYKRALAIREQALGVSHPAVGTTLNNLGLVYRAQTKYTKAAGLFERALAIREKALGASHPDVGQTLNNLGNVYRDLGKYVEAEALLGRALVIREQVLGTSHPDVASTLHNLADAVLRQGRPEEAEAFHKRALVIRENARGASHPAVAQALHNLALVSWRQGKYRDAEELNKRALAIREQALGANHPDVAHSLNNLAYVYWTQGKYSEAEGLYKRALAISEQALGESHPDVALNLKNLGLVYWTQGKYSEAEGLYKRALAIREKALGTGHPLVGETLNNLGLVYGDQGKYVEAEALLRRALAIREKALGTDHSEVGQTLNNLGLVYRAQAKYTEAEGLYERALAIREKALGANHPDVGQSLNNLANVYRDQGKYGEAEALYKRALVLREKALGASHPAVARGLNDMAMLYEARGESGSALAYSRKATAAILDHRTAESTGTPQTGAVGGLVERRASYFQRHVANLAVAARDGIEPAPSLAHEAIEVAQWASQSSAAAAVQQMSTRFASGPGALASLARESQDLAAAWREQDKAMLDALSNPEDRHEQARIDALRRKIAETEGRLNAVAARIDKEFPDYAALAQPKPLTAEEVQRLLGPDEALVFFLAGASESYVFALTRESFEWRTLSLGEKNMAAKVAAFRRGLHVDELTKSVSTGQAQLFDLAAAHELYVALFGPIEALIKDRRHLLFVPSGPLTALPFHLLVTQKPPVAVPESPSQYRDASWLLKRHAISVLPSVANLKALRQFAKTSSAPKSYVAFGNPLLLGPDGSDTGAWNRQQCPKDAPRVAVATRAAAPLPGISALFRGNLADVAEVQKLTALPDTADELCAVARQLGVPESEIWLGKRATEGNIKQMSEQGRLKSYGILHFATHGLVSGELKGLAEPALVLTPPAEASETDDGLLTASEVAQLRLNADWVVLSACNTAAAGAQGAEALSGLARAFFYAGARALLVSHWRVNSDAAVRLTTKAFAELRANPKIGRAEAMRRSMLDVITRGADQEVHPAYWAPFSLVGEGGG